MQLDHQGPVVTYSEATSRPPRRIIIPSPELTSGNVRLKLAAHEKEKEAALSHSGANTKARTRRRGHPQETWEEQELCRVRWRDAMHSMEREGAQQQEEYNREC